MSGSCAERVRLAYGQLTVDVASDVPDVLAWLVEFLAPAFQALEQGAGEADHHVRFVRAGPAHVAGLQQAARRASAVLDGFTYDGSFSRNPAWQVEGATWLQDERQAVFFCVGEQGRAIDVVVPDDTGSGRVALMRVLRELATVAMLRAGWLPIHGAAVVMDGGAVLMCGPRRAGKTSLLVHALRSGATFLSNDRLFVGPHAPADVRPMPTIVMLRAGTLDRFETLRRDFDAMRFDRARTVAACAPGIGRPDPPTPSGADRPGLSPVQFCRLLGAGMAAAAPARVVLFPRIDPGVRGIAIEPLDAGRALARLKQSLLKPSDPVRLSEAFAGQGPSAPHIPGAEDAACRGLLAQVSAHDVLLGPDAYDHDVLEAVRRYP